MTKAKIAILVLALSLQTSSTVRQSPPKTITLKDCEIQGLGKAKCGTLEVYENRATNKGRMIS